jgi:hypothetical protein
MALQITGFATFYVFRGANETTLKHLAGVGFGNWTPQYFLYIEVAFEGNLPCVFYCSFINLKLHNILRNSRLSVVFITRKLERETENLMLYARITVDGKRA